MSPLKDEEDIQVFFLKKTSHVFPMGKVCVGDLWEYAYERDVLHRFVVISFEITVSSIAAKVLLIDTLQKGWMTFADENCKYELIARLPEYDKRKSP